MTIKLIFKMSFYLNREYLVELNQPSIFYLEYAGYNCIAVRFESDGCWRGYIHLPPHHPDFDSHFETLPLQVHGGLSYGENGVFGFSIVDGWSTEVPTGVYYNSSYCRDQLQKLARQFAERN